MGKKDLPLSEYLTTREASQATGLTVQRLSQLAKAGKLGAVKKGFSWFFPRQKIYDYVAAVAGKDKFDPTRGDAY